MRERCLAHQRYGLVGKFAHQIAHGRYECHRRAADRRLLKAHSTRAYRCVSYTVLDRHFGQEMQTARVTDVEPAHIDLDGGVGVRRDRPVFDEDARSPKALLDILRQDAPEHLVERSGPTVRVHEPEPEIRDLLHHLGPIEVGRDSRPAQANRVHVCRVRNAGLGY